jgi:hypothetical protein
MFSYILQIISKVLRIPPDPSIQNIETRLGDIETTQARILRVLEELKQDEIPRNANRIYKISNGRSVLFLNELLPQVYLTLVSVLQGVVLAVLVDKFSFDYWEDNPVIYFYMASSLLIVVAFWFSYLSAIFDGRWPFHIVDTFLFFTSATAQAVAVSHVDNPLRWCQAIIVMCIVVALIYIRQVPLLRELQSLDLFEDHTEVEKRIRSVWLMTVLFLTISIVAFYYLPIVALDPQNPIAATLVVVFPVIYMIYSVYNIRRMNLDNIG